MDLLDLQKRTNIKPAVGKILIAEPFLTDPGFARTVILLCEHGENGSIGFILNRVSDSTLAELLPEFNHAALNIFDGGPVQQDTMHLIHTLPERMGGIEVLPGLFWGGSYAELSNMMDEGKCNGDNIKLFLGYSGWDKDQLEQELKDGAWIVADPWEGLIFNSSIKTIWQDAVMSLGRDFAFMANLPLHPQLN